MIHIDEVLHDERYFLVLPTTFTEIVKPVYESPLSDKCLTFSDDSIWRGKGGRRKQFAVEFGSNKISLKLFKTADEAIHAGKLARKIITQIEKERCVNLLAWST